MEGLREVLKRYASYHPPMQADRAANAAAKRERKQVTDFDTTSARTKCQGPSAPSSGHIPELEDSRRPGVIWKHSLYTHVPYP